MKTFIVFLASFFATASAFGQNPSASFSADVTSGCAPLAVTFTDHSTGNPTNWNWEFSNGTLSTQQNPVILFANPGTYSVKLVVKNANGIDELELINYITVQPSPAANFTADMPVSCAPGTVSFTDLSTPGAGTLVSWEWDFGDGNTSTAQNPSHTYTTPGFYTVTMTATNSNGCKQTAIKTNFIRIVDNVTVDFSFSQPSTCQPPFVVNFQNQSNGPGTLSYNWNFGNSQTSTAVNPSATYTSPGTYTVRLDARSNLGCTGFIEKPITITSTTTDFTAPVSACLNQAIRFQNNSSSPPVSSFWKFGDGTTSAQINPSKIYLTAGTYTVTLINQYDYCIDSVKKTITVSAQPAANFMANDSFACQAPFTVQFTDLSPNAVAWQWDFGDGNMSTLQNPTHQYTTFGNYTVSLVISIGAGCSNRIVKTDFIQIQPTTVSINVPDGGCIPFTYTPIATIQTVDPVVSYAWDLGEPGATFNVANPPPYTYTSAGNYTISLTVTTASGCTVTTSVPKGIMTGTRPVVDFSVTPLDQCASENIHFTDLSVTTPGAEVTWYWDFDDLTSSSEQNPGHIFQDIGNLMVNFIVSNNLCKDSVQKTVLVRPPVASFKASVDCRTKQVTFQNLSLVDPALTPLTYLWEMGDPANTQFTTNVPPAFTYPALGSYIVKLTVTNGPCSYVRSKTVTIVDEKPDFTINKNPVCAREVFTLTAINNNPANIIAYTWTINGATLTGPEPFLAYSIATPGRYDVSLTITDINGCRYTKTVPGFITVGGPTARFTAGSICLNKSAVFTDQSIPTGTIIQWAFNFGDGAQQNFSAPPFTHTYTTAGAYNVSLTVTDAAGCTDSYTRPDLLIVADLKAGFKADAFYCPGAPLQFIDTSEGAGLSFQWSFGDGNTSTLQNPTNIYPLGDADYTVKLKIRDISGCEDSVTRINYVKIRSPKAAFAIEDTFTICPPLRTSFTFQGSDYQTFYWDFGDGGTSGAQNPAYFYNGFGHFIPTLHVIGPGGCRDSAKASVTVYDVYSYAKIDYGPPTTACNSLNVNFNITIPPGFPFVFHFGDGSTETSGATSFSHLYPRPSFNEPYMDITDTISGCEIRILGGPRIDVLGAVPLFGKDRKEFCDSGLVVFKDFTVKNEPIIARSWDFGDGGSATSEDAAHKYTQPGLYTVTLTITTQSNCVSTYRDTVYVYRTPAPAIAGRDTICLNVAELFTGSIAVADTLTNWQWDFGNGQTSTQPNAMATYTSPGDYTITLRASNKLDCGNTIPKKIYVAPLPTADPVQDPITIISGASTDLLMTYTGNVVSYNWSPVTRLDCITCPQPKANPQFTTEYTVQIEDTYGCRNSGGITVVVICNNQNIFIPNTFSPNGDGQNEVFYPRGTGLFRVKSMTVFNRWGQIVFERKDFSANDPAAGWPGLFQGKKASADVYIYMIEVLCDNNTVVPLKGNVTLLR